MSKIIAMMNVRQGEAVALAWGFMYFFCVLCSYYILRPIRDEMGIQGGVENLQWLFSATFVAMLVAVPLFGTVVQRLPRTRLIPFVYAFFIATLLLFFVLMRVEWRMDWVARAFFVWISVFNLFVVSIFWSFMADVFSNEQAKRLFGVVAAGGSAGAVAGPALTVLLVNWAGVANLLLASTGLLCVAVLCAVRLTDWRDRNESARADRADAETVTPIGGHPWAGLVHVLRVPYLRGIALYIVAYTAVATFLYFIQAHVVRDAFDLPENRTAFFAGIDLAVNGLTVLVQLFLTGWVVTRLGMTAALIVLPLSMLVGLAALSMVPILGVIAIVQVFRRVLNYALARPAREVLYTLVDTEDKYKTKNVTDTLVYRGGDAASAWLYAGLAALGMSIAHIAVVGLPIVLVWAWVGRWLARRHDATAAAVRAPTPGFAAEPER